jgi:predicted MFS family arabinose efflux permease
VIGRVGFDGLFVAAAAAQLVSWALVWALPPLPDGARGVEPRRNFWAALAQRDLLPMWFMAILFGAGLETIFTFTRTMVDERRVGTVGLFFGVYGAVAIAGRVAASSRFDRAPQRALLVSSIAAIGAGIVLAGSATRLSTFMVAAALSGLGHGLSYPILSSQIVSRARAAERGSAIAIFTSIFDVALFTVTPLVGLTIDLSGYPAAFGGVGIAVVAGALVYAWWDRSLRPSPSPITPPSVPEAV